MAPKKATATKTKATNARKAGKAKTKTNVVKARKGGLFGKCLLGSSSYYGKVGKALMDARKVVTDQLSNKDCVAGRPQVKSDFQLVEEILMGLSENMTRRGAINNDGKALMNKALIKAAEAFKSAISSSGVSVDETAEGARAGGFQDSSSCSSASVGSVSSLSSLRVPRKGERTHRAVALHGKARIRRGGAQRVGKKTVEPAFFFDNERSKLYRGYIKRDQFALDPRPLDRL